MSRDPVMAVIAHLAAGKEVRLMDDDGDYTVAAHHELRIIPCPPHMDGNEHLLAYCVCGHFNFCHDDPYLLTNHYRDHVGDEG